ncbi:MAG: polysaccharide biosynthesis tyrosine autokinase [Planctomycetes bacterium]|nr:polysaccharide biosynthesis tyrosine autokinase [Planctomycetota bacterium]
MVDRTKGNDRSGPPQPMNGIVPDLAGMPGSGQPDSLVVVLWRHSWIIIGCVVLALIGGFVYLAKATPLFTSSSRLYVEKSGPKIMSDMEEGIFTGSQNYLYTQVELMKATPILAEALKKCDAGRMRTFADVTNRIVALENTLEATVGKKNDILSVSFKSPYPDEAAHIVNSVVDAYITFHGTLKRTTAVEVLKILQQEKTKRDQELSQRLHAMTAFQDENEAVALQADSGNMILDRLNRLSDAYTAAELATLEANSYYESAKAMARTPGSLQQFIDVQQQAAPWTRNSEKSGLTTLLNQLRFRRADRTRQLTRDHPAVKALDEEITDIEQQIQALDQQYAQAQLAVLEQQYLAAAEKENQLGQHFDEQRTQALQQSRQISQYTILRSEWEQSKKICDALDDRIRELNVTEDAGVLNITILEVAEVAEKPSDPQPARTMAMALVLGLMAGGGLALLRDMLDHRIRSVDEVAALLGAPLLGTMPAMNKKASLSDRGQEAATDAMSPTAEAVRTIRTAIFFSVPQDQARTILITSPMPGEGKSTVVSNLAIAMAQSGQRVLILDGDFRKPTQHIIFGVNRENGVAALLAGMKPIGETVVQTQTEGPYLMSSGPEVPNPAEMLGSQTFKDLLAKLAGEFDRIIVDSPPVMAVADAAILAATCDATVLVVRAEKSTRRAVQNANRKLQAVGGRLIGAIVNDVKHSKGRDGYGYGYGYGKKDKSNGKNDSPTREQGKTVPSSAGRLEEGVKADGRALG